MNEQILGKKICLMASEIGARIFRNNVGMGWIGETVRFTKEAKVIVYPGDVIIRKARPLHAGLCQGSGDYIGFSKIGKFISLEIKTETGKIREGQQEFSDAVNSCGGIAGIIRDEESAFELLS